jgi:hypothetical protein
MKTAGSARASPSRLYRQQRDPPLLLAGDEGITGKNVPETPDRFDTHI